ncbi:sigma-70 family RNA polymerase sigma factor [Sorangium sp. So ce1036]|uniref:RNA polymerase sigma factor n=1 Tax=Sorangium sp. So ce1036 TaxID=3133328 RepID=UPI003F0B6AD8
MQEIFLSSWRSMEVGRFRPSQDVPLKKALRHWLLAVGRHHVSHYRERMYRLYKERATCTVSGPPSHAPSPFGQVQARLALRRLEWLGPELRDVLTGTVLGYTAREIVAKLGGNPNTTNGRLHRGRRQLQKVLR